jgi:hypothetical protein
LLFSAENRETVPIEAVYTFPLDEACFSLLPLTAHVCTLWQHSAVIAFDAEIGRTAIRYDPL